MASGNGVLSKFQERLWRIRMARGNKKKNKEVDAGRDGIRDLVIVRRGIADNKRIITNTPSNPVRTNIPKGIVIVDKGKKDTIKEILPRVDDGKNTNIKVVIHGVNVKSNKKKEFKKKNTFIDKKEKDNDILNNKGILDNLIDDEKKKEELEKLEKDLFKKIRKNFSDKLDELEILESELYFISVEKDNAIVREKIAEVKKKIDAFIQELNDIIRQYNAYADNYYIDNVLAITDKGIVDDLINYRTLVNSLSDERAFVREYKKFVEFKSLYNKLKEVQLEVERIREEANKKDYDIVERNKKYKEIGEKLANDSSINKSCLDEIDRQNEYFNDLISKINVINREEYTTYHLRGIGDLIGMSLRYIGLMMVSPLSGIIPGIAIQTMATRRFIGNIRNRLHFEEVTHVHYDAIDYSSELSQKLTDINYVSGLIDDTLNDIENLRIEFMKQYDSNIPGYEDTLDKLNKVEEVILRNQNKVVKIQDMINVSKKINDEKLVRVREMNNSN